MTLRAIGPFNGTLPEPTGMIVGFLRNPSSFPYLRYTQFVPTDNVSFMYCVLDNDEPVRIINTNEYVWAYDDYRPTGKGSTLRANWIEGRMTRWDFPYTIGETTIEMWKKSKVDTTNLFNLVKASQAAVHRSSRIVSALSGATWGTNNTSDLNTLLGTSGVYMDKSSGTQYDPATGIENPFFQVIKRAFNIVKRRIHLATNGVVNRNSLYAIIPPVVAQAISTSGEIFEALKQSQFAERLVAGDSLDSPNVEDWNIVPRLAGFNLIVEDTPRVFINQKADGTIADASVPAQRDYILAADDIYFVSRPGGLDGGYGQQSYSTLQVYVRGGEARIEAFSEPKHELVEGHVVMEDSIQTPAMISGFKLTNVLST